jgi:Indoleamine 2,3-dioxygenase
VEEMRKSMPGEWPDTMYCVTLIDILIIGYHARFLDDLKSLPSIRQFLASMPPGEEADLKGAYNKAVEALAAFRTEQVQIVTLYVLSPSKRSPELVDGDQNAPMEGSGGSGDLFALLKGMRDDTKNASVDI